MKKAVLLAAVCCGVLGLSSCCRIVDCCFEDPCVPKCNPCEMMKKKDSGCNPCGGYQPSCSKPCGECNKSETRSPQAKGCTSPDGRCRQ
ncbi:Small cysteine-rich outer membrane protein OmcA [Chlamydia avium]|uniref:Small cysteine-rich outer membrane protein OmcA n=1 Tax=Chlamydia avium 10DC88 TaxID=1229831 RepID=W8JE91_9CHLA|nr:small cysteine-rich outer membrane protein [Chlamydia avium]AHK62891.1 Small cysteine-rich outer membrane protein OmcA [Chlamydia avium 10DC88]VVT42510.1 Small cysteine-rich outer membrane protein OmcA [Chlamydia avium]